MLSNWKEILGSIAAGLVVLLQIINIFLSNDIDHTLTAKAAEVQQKAELLQKLVNQNVSLTSEGTTVSKSNGEALKTLKSDIDALVKK